MAFTKVQSGFIDLSVSSGLTVGAGSASTPAINFSDNSTGFFRPGSNEIGVALSGSQKFTFKNNNFGIGTNSPDVPLVVVGNTKISGNTHIGSPSGSAARLAVYKETQSSGSPVFEAYSNITNNAQTKIFVVDGDGEVGIGIGNPSALLHTQNNSGENQFRISSSQGSYRRIIFHDSNSNPTKYNFQIAVQEVDNSIHIGPSSAVGGLSFSGSNGIVVKSDGKVGIGNDNPAQLLTVGAITGGADGNLSVKTNSNTHAIAIEENSGNENYQLGVNSSGDLGFYNSGAAAATVTFADNDRVGIGENNPDSRLHVKGGSLTVEHLSPQTGTCQLNINCENNSQVSFSFDDQGHISFGSSATPHNQGSFSEKVRIQNGGGISFNGDTAQANALDDYEEGTYSPTLKFGSGSTGIAYGNNTGGSYTKIGRLVYVHIRIEITNKGSSTGSAKVTNLPFTIGNHQSGNSSVEGSWAIGGYQSNAFLTTNSDRTAAGCKLMVGTNEVELMHNDYVSGTSSAMSHSAFNNSSSFAFDIVYQTT